MVVDKPKLRVLHVTEAYGGGVATALTQYAKHESFQSSLLLRIRESNHTDSPFPSQVRVTYVDSLLAFVVQWFKHRKLKFDVIHVHSTIAGLVVRLFPHRTASIAYSPHAFAFTGHKSGIVRYLARVVEQALTSRTAAGGAVSQDEANIFTELGLSKEKVIVIPHHLEISKRKPQKPIDLRILSIGRLSHQKNPETLKLFKECLDSFGVYASWTWVGAGDEEYSNMLKDAGVTVTGWLGIDEVRKLLANSTFLFHPARYEGLPMAVLESLAEGIPVLASDIPAHRSIESVVIFKDVGDAAELAQKIMSPDSWEILSLKGIEEIRSRFNAQSQNTALNELYRMAVSKGNRVDFYLSQER